MTVFQRHKDQTSTPLPAAYEKRRSVVASAARVNLSNKDEAESMRKRLGASAEWQKDAWAYFDGIGEIKFAYNMVGSIVSRLRLYVGVVTDESEAPIPVHEAFDTPEEEDDGDSTASDKADARDRINVDRKVAEAAAELFQKTLARSSVPNILRNLSINIDVPGEGYLVLYKDAWTAKSTTEITLAPSNSGYMMRRSRADTPIKEVPKDEMTVGRVWRPHPEFSLDPDSALLGIRDDCEELMLLSRMIRVITRAKLNAGLLYVPDEITVAARATPDADSEDVEDEEIEEDAFIAELVHALNESTTDETSMSTVMPTVLRGPAEAGKLIQHILIERKVDEFLVNRAQAVLDRILTSLDAPKDVITGLANVKYSNAIQIDESMYKAHIEPKGIIVCDAFTDIVLHPQLKALFPEADVSRIVVWYDPSEVVTRPNRSEDADKGYDKFLLSGASWRDAHGFSDQDAPDEGELAARLALNAVVPPELAQELLHRLLPSIVQSARAGAGTQLPAELDEALGDDQTEAPQVGEASDSGGTP